MKQFILNHKKALAGIATALVLGIITMSFQDSPFMQQRLGVQQVFEDTIPKKKINQAEFDKAMKEFESAMQQFSEELKKIDMSQITAAVNRSEERRVGKEC